MGRCWVWLCPSGSLREVQREVRRIENEYKFLLVQGLVGGVMKYFFKDEETTVCKEDAKQSAEQ
ncbi:MAG: hypothetical protein ACLRXQ_03750 [Phascolarctobacterium faecium]